jgi:O-antigen/teichoic acid export membrane protein
MGHGKLLKATALYGAGDVVVLAVGGFFLLPLYTRTLSQTEFGIYVIVKTNAEIFSYLLYFGLPSAIARLYFQYRNENRHVEYLRSVIFFYLMILVIGTGVFGMWGDRIWRALSPTVPSYPYLWISLTLAAIGFFATLGPLWLRLEARARAFATLQVCTSLVLAALAAINLVFLHQRLYGLFTAMIASSVFSATALVWLFRGRFRFRLKLRHITESLQFAAPIFVGYVAYFVLNRISTVMLQRFLPVDQVAIFGLAQQLAMIITISATAFGKAFQPAVYGAERSEAYRMVEETGKTFILVMIGLTSVMLLFGNELLWAIAPKNYSTGSEILSLLVFSGFIYSFGLISDTAMLYARKPNTSMVVSVVGALVSLLLSVLWIPIYQLRGAAVAIATAYSVKAIIGHAMFKRITGRSYMGFMLSSSAMVGAIAAFAIWLGRVAPASLATVLIKALVATTVVLILYRIYMGKVVLNRDIG